MKKIVLTLTVVVIAAGAGATAPKHDAGSVPGVTTVRSAHIQALPLPDPGPSARGGELGPGPIA